MTTAAQLANACNSLETAIRQYQTTAMTLEANTAMMSEEVFGLLVDWKGGAPTAFTHSQQQAARDAYRVVTALLDSSYAMLSLLSVIEANQQAVAGFENLSGMSVKGAEVSAAYDRYTTALLVIEEKANSLGAQLSDIGQTLGNTCSAGNEPLPPGQIDGVINFIDTNGKVVLMSKASNQAKQQAKGKLGRFWQSFLQCMDFNNQAFKQSTIKSLFIIGALSGVMSAYFNSLVAWHGFKPKDLAVAGGNFAQGLLAPFITWAAAVLACAFVGPSKQTLALPIIAPLIGGGLVSFGGFYKGIDSFFQHSPPPIPSQSVLLNRIQETEQELKNSNLPQSFRNVLQGDLQVLKDEYTRDFGPLPTPTPKPTSTPTPPPPPTWRPWVK